ncbi:hypothetical protein NVIE_1071 [Nitrososphaera viennensis EN76]|uniref:Uncharacterized protein n=1 Tax=Nitrososphaera viennensis EN76 TaxID=926571 RepID=A0A060HQ10_9ARCH|nr:hypothetical protein NVIE_1071 [Nitrososphaera viennensis EN76]
MIIVHVCVFATSLALYLDFVAIFR